MVFVCKKSSFRISDWVTGQNWLRSKRVIFITRGIRLIPKDFFYPIFYFSINSYKTYLYALKLYFGRLLTCLTLGIKSGGYTFGFLHCSSFNNRIHNFNSTTDIDPSFHPSFAASLRRVCPAKNNAKKAGVAMDPSSSTFDKYILQIKFCSTKFYFLQIMLCSIPPRPEVWYLSLLAQMMLFRKRLSSR
ncbi:putative peroxidase [Helianthus annuus]|nr:putative peroxidase [Helianthus annuus]